MQAGGTPYTVETKSKNWSVASVQNNALKHKNKLTI